MLTENVESDTCIEVPQQILKSIGMASMPIKHLSGDGRHYINGNCAKI
jgi:hypothetical protein